MRKIVFLLVAFVSFSFSAMADQLFLISEEQAKAAVQLLQKQKNILLYCGCCDDGELQYVKITNVYYSYSGIENYYEVFVEGSDTKGHKVSTAIDLAYAHIKNGNYAMCVGLALKIDCDPCVNNLPWSCPFSDEPDESEMYYYLTITNTHSSPRDISIEGKYIGQVPGHESKKFKLKRTLYGKISSVQASGYLISPNTESGIIKNKPGANEKLSISF